MRSQSAATTPRSWETMSKVMSRLERSVCQQGDDLASRDDIERAHGLVGEEDAWPADDGPGDRDPLALAAGELVGIQRLGGSGQAHRLERFRDERISGAAVRDPQRPHRLPHDASHALARVQRRVGVLEDRLDAPAERADQRPVPQVERDPVEQDPAGGRAQKAQQQPHQRALSGAGLTDQADALPWLDGERDVLHGELALGRASIGEAHGIELQDRGHPSSARAMAAAKPLSIRRALAARAAV